MDVKHTARNVGKVLVIYNHTQRENSKLKREERIIGLEAYIFLLLGDTSYSTNEKS